MVVASDGNILWFVKVKKKKTQQISSVNNADSGVRNIPDMFHCNNSLSTVDSHKK